MLEDLVHQKEVGERRADVIDTFRLSIVCEFKDGWAITS
jgi:hypothetical protein